VLSNEIVAGQSHLRTDPNTASLSCSSASPLAPSSASLNGNLDGIVRKVLNGDSYIVNKTGALTALNSCALGGRLNP